MTEFERYRDDFEERVIIAGLELGEFGIIRDVSAQPGKLDGREFGRRMGDTLESDLVCVLDYYGYLKKSRGFKMRIAVGERALRGWPIKALRATIIHFAGVRLELVAELAPDLVRGFVRFKGEILDLRGFRHNLRIGGNRVRVQPAKSAHT